eukprot:1118323-Rhodomonas_salina.1
MIAVAKVRDQTRIPARAVRFVPELRVIAFDSGTCEIKRETLRVQYGLYQQCALLHLIAGSMRGHFRHVAVDF